MKELFKAKAEQNNTTTKQKLDIQQSIICAFDLLPLIN